jgi:dihydroneopterin aldolase
MDEIAITGIRVFGRHGAYTGEKDRPQAFDLALRLDVDLAAASVSDRLADTIDYAAIHRRVVEVVEQQSFDLLERLGAEILDAVFVDARVRAAEVSIGKPGLLDGATATVTLRRSSSGDTG